MAPGAVMDQEAIAVDALRKEIAERLKSICAHIPASEFDRYVERLAYVEHSYQLADDLESLTFKRQALGEQP